MSEENFLKRKIPRILLVMFLSLILIGSIVGIIFYNIDTNDSNGNTIVEKTTDLSYAIVDTNQIFCYDNSSVISAPSTGDNFYGQDAQFDNFSPSYEDNGDGTVTDLNTGLMWQQDPGDKMTYDDSVMAAETFNLAGYTDWRLPTIKELYSLILFSGEDPSGVQGDDTSGLTPFIDTDYFIFEYGDTANNERIIDSQYVSCTKYVSTTMEGDETVFGVNFADGRIKGYGTGAMPIPGQEGGKLFSVMYVRGNTEYGQNVFIDNGDSTITDNATGFMWMQNDSIEDMTWMDALIWVQEMNDQSYLGYNDWRLPNVKELQSIVEYSRSPDTTNSAAIDQLFSCTSIIAENGELDFGFYWSSTTHATSNGFGGFASYVAFGESLGFMNDQWMDVHGAGSQRSDPKDGDPDDFTEGHGPQGDAIRIFNLVRLVRTA